MKLYVMLAFTRNQQSPNQVLIDVFAELRRQAFQVEIGVFDEILLDPARIVAQHDLYLLKSHTTLWLSIAGILHAQNARLLNPYLACLAAHNKIVAAQRLRAGHIRVPETWVTGDLHLLQKIILDRPLILKPYTGNRGEGIVIARTPEDLQQLMPLTQPMLVQEYFSDIGEELKVYGVGHHVFGIRKTETQRIPIEIDDELRTLALRCGEWFGLGLYGLDVLKTESGYIVVDLNYFPSYKGVPNVAPVIANYIAEYATGRRPELQPPPLFVPKPSFALDPSMPWSA